MDGRKEYQVHVRLRSMHCVHVCVHDRTFFALYSYRQDLHVHVLQVEWSRCQAY